MLVTGCASEIKAPINECPTWVEPLGWSSRDTEETRREIHAHNFKYDEFCAVAKPDEGRR